MAKLSRLKGMQDARDKDMYHLSNSTCLRYNGHLQVSPGGKGGKKERKGCTKGKLEAVMRNSSFGSSIISSANMTVSSMTNSHGNHFIRASHSVKPPQVDQDDPYTFTETEPQLTAYYPSGSSSGSTKKPNNRTNESLAARRASTESSSSRRSSVESSTLARRINVDPSPRRSVDTPTKTALLKTRTAEPNPSKMNKLQADFARNKLMGKRRKVDQPPHIKWDPSQKKVCSRVLIPNKKTPRKTTWQREKKARHELLERIEEAKNEWESIHEDIFPLGPDVSDTENDSEDSSVYERHWFTRCGRIETREDRVSLTRSELSRELSQAMRGVSVADSSPMDLLRSVISAARILPNATAHMLDSSLPHLTPTARYINKISKGGMFLLRGEKCSYWEGCTEQALPCTRHCSRHIMYNVDQRLFNRCTAKSIDNTQCNIPVVDVTHHLPLCPHHALQHERYKMMSNEAKNKKIIKKNRVVGISRSNKRSQKKKKKVNASGGGSVEEMELSRTLATLRPDMDIEVTHGLEDGHTTIHIPEPPDDSLGHAEHLVAETSLQAHLPPPVPPPPINAATPSLEVDGEVPEEVLEIASLDPAELAHQATRLLEEHDLTNVLNQISPDAFNDLFAGFAAEDKNGGYEPTREETEELDRALEAVDNDVRSLEERMTRQLPLLPLVDPFLDDPHLSFPATDIQPSS